MATSSTIASTLVGRHVGERGAAAVGGQHLIAVTPQRGGKRLAHGRVVVDNEDPHVTHYARDSRRRRHCLIAAHAAARLRCLTASSAAASRAGLTPRSWAIAANAGLAGSTPSCRSAR